MPQNMVIIGLDPSPDWKNSKIMLVKQQNLPYVDGYTIHLWVKFLWFTIALPTLMGI